MEYRGQYTERQARILRALGKGLKLVKIPSGLYMMGGRNGDTKTFFGRGLIVSEKLKKALSNMGLVNGKGTLTSKGKQEAEELNRRTSYRKVRA